MTVLYFGNYNSSYSRNRVLIKGLRQNGVKLIECNVRKSGFRALIPLFFKYLRLNPSYDLMIVGFPGQEVMFLARFITKKPIIFDAFTSHYGGYILDRKYFPTKSLRAKYYRFLDKWSCKLADLVLLDTNAHIDFFIKEFGLPKEKFIRIFVGTDSDIFYPRNDEKSDDKFLVHHERSHEGSQRAPASYVVHFHGHYIPLQGVRHIIETAKILEKENIIFNLIGQGQTYKEDKKLAERYGLKNINFIDSVPYDKLPDYMAEADVCLGVFGDNPKTDLVIPNKIYEALAMGKPVITADTPAIRELLNDGEDVFLCLKANPESLARKILLVKNQPSLARKTAEKGRNLFERKLKEKFLGEELLKNFRAVKQLDRRSMHKF